MTQAAPLILRPYQTAAVDSIRSKYASGVRKVLLWLPTGGGKTVIFCRILDGVRIKARRALTVVRGRMLVDQASQRLFREGIDHGCLMAGHWNVNPTAPIQVASVDTLFRRKLAPPADLIVIDEAHLAASDSFKWLFAQYPNAFYLAVTATPWVKSGLRHVAEEIVHPISFSDLIEQGYLARPRYFAPTRLDLDGVRTDSKTGDYVAADVAAVMDGAAIYGDVVANYREKLQGMPAVLFAVDVKHSIMIRDRFREAGIRAEHVEADTPASERKRVMDDVESGICQVVCNVGILTTGVDMPALRGVILCRATKSRNLYVQMIGRGTRIAERKDSFIVLDHANNVAAHGFVENEPDVDLDGVKPRDPSDEQPCQCEQCYGCFYAAEAWTEANPELAALGKQGRSYVCPYCGHDNRTQREAYERKKDEDVRATLREIVAPPKAKLTREETAIEKLITTALERGYKGRWVYHRLIEKYGADDGERHWTSIRKRFGDVS